MVTSGLRRIRYQNADKSKKETTTVACTNRKCDRAGVPSLVHGLPSTTVRDPWQPRCTKPVTCIFPGQVPEDATFVYVIITSIDYEGGYIAGIFEDRIEAACHKAKLDRAQTGDWNNLVRVKLNDPNICIDVPYFNQQD